MGLHVGVAGAKEFLGTLNGQCFHFVNKFASAIVAVSGIAFCIFVGEAGTLGLTDCGRDKVL